MQAQADPGVHQGQYQKNLTYKGPVTGDEIIYTFYLPPGYAKEKGPYPIIVFLHGAGGGNASSQVIQSYEAARKAGWSSILVAEENGPDWRVKDLGRIPNLLAGAPA